MPSVYRRQDRCRHIRRDAQRKRRVKSRGNLGRLGPTFRRQGGRPSVFRCPPSPPPSLLLSCCLAFPGTCGTWYGYGLSLPRFKFYLSIKSIPFRPAIAFKTKKLHMRGVCSQNGTAVLRAIIVIFYSPIFDLFTISKGSAFRPHRAGLNLSFDDPSYYAYMNITLKRIYKYARVSTRYVCLVLRHTLL